MQQISTTLNSLSLSLSLSLDDDDDDDYKILEAISKDSEDLSSILQQDRFSQRERERERYQRWASVVLNRSLRMRRRASV
jgi:hypothetical protein